MPDSNKRILCRHREVANTSDSTHVWALLGGLMGTQQRTLLYHIGPGQSQTDI